ncbi:MAG: glycosyltransferase family 2 protein [Candidatus Roizmanbacteria bacterium]|nr:glycosyltransferase family 2 protein [Candidatus Roizmanbacteria bacterium]
MNKFLLSIIVPVHNEEKNIPILVERLSKAVQNYTYEILFIDDGSTDSTLSILKNSAATNKLLKIYSFTRNFGHQNALFCGYQKAKGDCVISIDADLQDPPEIIPTMVKKWEKGTQIVYARRQKRKDSPFKKLTAYIFYRFLNILSDVRIPTDVGDFRLLDKTVVTYIKNLPEHNKYIRGLVSWGGFSWDQVEYNRDERFAGTTHYTFSKMLNLALDGLISFSIKPLRVAMYIGFVTAMLGILGITYALYRRIFLPHEFWITGWTTLFIAVLFMGGIQLITIGIIGEYIGKTYQESQNRPPYLLKETTNA